MPELECSRRSANAKEFVATAKNTDDDVLTAALAAPEVVPDEEKEQSVEDSEDKEGAVEKDMT